MAQPTPTPTPTPTPAPEAKQPPQLALPIVKAPPPPPPAKVQTAPAPIAAPAQQVAGTPPSGREAVVGETPPEAPVSVPPRPVRRAAVQAVRPVDVPPARVARQPDMQPPEPATDPRPTGRRAVFRRPVPGGVLPPELRAARFTVRDYDRWNLGAPDAGYRWVRVYDDAVLIDDRGVIADVIYDVDWAEAPQYATAEREPPIAPAMPPGPPVAGAAWAEYGAGAPEGMAEDRWGDGRRHPDSTRGAGYPPPGPADRSMPPAPGRHEYAARTIPPPEGRAPVVSSCGPGCTVTTSTAGRGYVAAGYYYPPATTTTVTIMPGGRQTRTVVRR
ncbi:RcnB family protein [Stakelama saccharophila]|uniref:RcnB family protein n=1 Tax=Stakelama saccharophila TaxID=3075605 RepID=A0ABZ0BCR0_9SPHN|nr:RcnB family protein [Stakelama sp. W311]WNO54841.1 RcnB family protein [Stakelama sp. W311]